MKNMKKTISTLIAVLCVAFAMAQIPGGTYSIPGDYASILEAVTTLNTDGISGDILFIVEDDYTETAPLNGIVLGSSVLNASSVTYTLTFQRSGTGTNPPLITAFTGGTSTAADGIWKIAGTDNVTIDGIDLAENPLNVGATQSATQALRMEWGYALVKLSNVSPGPYDGCQNVTIKNCTITLNKYFSLTAWTNCYGIYSGNHIATATVSINLADGNTNDVHNNSKFYGNTITNVSHGIYMVGWNGALPPTWDMYDSNTEIGVESPNIITNFSLYGIFVRQAKAVIIANNSLSSVTERPASSIYGIYTTNIAGSDTYYNTVTIQPPASNPSNNFIYGLNLTISSDNNFSGSVYNNTVQNCTNTSTSAGFTGISVTGNAFAAQVHDNAVINNVIPGTGSFYGMDIGGFNVDVYDNLVANNQKTGTINATSTFNCLRAGGSGLSNVYNNQIYSNYNQTNSGFSAGNINGLMLSNSTAQTINAYNNSIFDLLTTGASTYTIANGINISAGSNLNVYNNFISDLRSTAGTGTLLSPINSIAGINVSSTSATTKANLYFNTIYLNAAASGNFFYIADVFAHTNPTVDMRNNILVNESTTPSTSGVICAYRRTTTTMNTYSNLSNANVFYVINEASGSLNVTYADNGTNFATFAEYQALIGPVREAGSFSELPPFVNKATAPFDLHLQTAIATNCESGGIQVSSPVVINDDFDGNTRALVPDIGADEFAGLSLASVINPGGVFTTLISSSQVDVAFTPNASNNNVLILWNNDGAFTAPSGTPPAVGSSFAGGTVLSYGTTSPINHTGLNGATTYYYKAFSFDLTNYSMGVMVSALTNIDAPSGLTATTISDSQIDLAWNKNVFNNDVIIANNTTTTFGQPVNGTAYLAGDPIPGGGTVVYVGSLTAASNTGLLSYTLYNYKAWSVDALNNNVYSPTGVTASATTYCSADNIPYAEGFEHGGVIGCGSIYDNNADPYFTTWAVYYTTTHSHSGTYIIRINQGQPLDEWYFTNQLNLTAGVTYEVKFWYKTTALSAPYHSLEVKWGNAPSVAGMTSAPIYYSTALTSTTYVQMVCSSITPATTGTYHFGFHNFTPSSVTGTYLYLDDITVTATNIPTDITWAGGVNNDWFNSGNWNPIGVPGSITNITIPAGLTNYPTISSNANCNDLMIQSGASLIDNSLLTVLGTSTINRDYSGGEWHLISSPVANATASMFMELFLQNHTESTNLYTDITNPSTPLIPMQGYALWNDLIGTASFQGTLNSGNIGAADNLTRINQGWNLVGNPYASPIDWDAASGWTKTNVDDATYRHVNNATWASYVGGVGINGGSRYIPSCQGFFVGVSSGFTTGTLSMSNGVRTHSTSDFYKDEVSDLVRLQVSGNGYTDETVIRFLDDAMTGFDSQWDAHKLFGIVPESPAIYSVENGMMSINTLPSEATTHIGVKAGVPGEFTISATETSEFTQLNLEDLVTGDVTNLLQDSYTFSYSINSDNRFMLHFTSMGMPEKPASPIQIYPQGQYIVVIAPNDISGNLSVFNLMGQEIANTGIHGGLNTISIKKNAYYIVKVVCNDGVITEKILIK